jgi:transposase
MRFDLTDTEWSALELLIPAKRRTARADDRRVIDAILHVLRTGMPWRDLPERYGPYTTAYNRFNRWSRRGIWKRMFETFAAKSRDGLHFVDGTIVKAHRSASGAKGGRQGKESVSVAEAGVRKFTRRSTAKPPTEACRDRRAGSRQPGRRGCAHDAPAGRGRLCR